MQLDNIQATQRNPCWQDVRQDTGLWSREWIGLRKIILQIILCVCVCVCVCVKCQEHDKMFFEQMDLTELLKVWNTLPQPCQPIYTHTSKHTLTHLNVAQKPIIWDMVIVTDSLLDRQSVIISVCSRMSACTYLSFFFFFKHRHHSLSWSCTLSATTKLVLMSNCICSICLNCCLFINFDLSSIKISTFFSACLNIYASQKLKCVYVCVCISGMQWSEKRERIVKY